MFRPTGTRLRPNLRRAREFLLDHLADKVTLDDLADHARTDKFHLCREFSRVLDRGENLGAIVTADFGRSAAKIVAALRQRGINTSATFRAWAILDMEAKRAQSAVRISPHYYNTEAEVDAVVDALRSLASRSG